MAVIQDLLREDTNVGLRQLAGTASDRSVRSVVSVPMLAAIEEAPAWSLVVVPAAVLQSSAPWELDLAVRQAAGRDVTSLLLVGAESIPITTSRLADRTDISILTCHPVTDVSSLIVILDQLLRGDAASVLSRSLGTIEAVRDFQEGGEGDLENLLSTASALLGTPIRLVHADEPGEPIMIDGHCFERIAADHEDDATALALPAVAAAASVIRGELRRSASAPDRARAESISEIIIAEETSGGLRAADRARTLGFSIDGVHAAVCFKGDSVPGEPAASLVTVRLRRDWILSTLIGYTSSLPDEWTIVPSEDDVLAILTRRSSRASDWGKLPEIAHSMALTLKADRPGVPLYIGVGSAQVGAAGLRLSSAESRSAASSARSTGLAFKVTPFDVTGVRRVLADIRTSPISLRVLDNLLAPLDALGEQRSRTAIETLSALLDAQGSPRHAAVRLHLHTNAVNYRMNWIKEALDMDLNDPDTLFALHLACRVRLLNPGSRL